MKYRDSLSILCGVMTLNVIHAAEDATGWLSFRNGGSSAIAGDIPLSVSPDSGILWQLETDGYGQSAPLIVNNQAIISSVIGDMKQTSALTAYDLVTGKQLWQNTAKASQLGPSNYMNARAAPTPVADTDGVYSFYESGVLMAVDLKGQKLWVRDLAREMGDFSSRHGLGSSPAQSEDLLFLNLEHNGPSCLIAFNKSDGKTVWKTERPEGSSWTSPVVLPKQELVVISSSGHLAAYDVNTGKEVWKVEGLEGNSVPSPCVINDRIFVGARVPEFGAASDAAASNCCVEVGLDSARTVWKAENAVCDYASPVVDGNEVYFLNKVGVLTCVDAASGKELFRQRLRCECWATPIVANNGIHFFGKDGTVRTIQRGPEFKVTSTGRLWPEDAVPKPESYKEFSGTGGASGHGASGHGSSHGGGNSDGRFHDQGTTEGTKRSHAAEGEGGSTGGGRAGGMIAAMMRGDSNLDGILTQDEISPDFLPMLKRVDTNGDGSLDKAELEAMAKSFAERRRNSQSAARDPIVYGVAAIPGTVIVRTGTRLFCLSQKAASNEKAAP